MDPWSLNCRGFRSFSASSSILGYWALPACHRHPHSSGWVSGPCHWWASACQKRWNIRCEFLKWHSFLWRIQINDHRETWLFYMGVWFIPISKWILETGKELDDDPFRVKGTHWATPRHETARRLFWIRSIKVNRHLDTGAGNMPKNPDDPCMVYLATFAP